MQESPPSSTQPTHVLIMVHGIRTFGRWQERLERLVKECDPQTKVYKYKYGFFSILEYWTPFLGWIATNRFRRHLGDIAKQHPNTRIDIVAHSFGTHLVGWGLLRCPRMRRPKAHTIILASSVLKTSFPWQQLIHEGAVRRVINECAASDLALVFNILVPFTGGPLWVLLIVFRFST